MALQIIRKNTNKVRNILGKIFKSSKNKKWRRNQLAYWDEYLVLNETGFSLFQLELFETLKQVLKDNNISFESEVAEHLKFNNRYKVEKMITVTLEDKSVFWIYREKANFSIDYEPQFFDSWDYLKPEALMDGFMKSMKDLLKLES